MAFLYVAATMLLQYDKDTKDVSGAVFLVLSILAGVTFTYAGCLDLSDPDRKEILYGGERLLQGSMIFLAASLLKYAILALPGQLAAVSAAAHHVENAADQANLDFVTLLLEIIVFLVFVYGLVVSQLGYYILSRVIGRRIARRADQRMFPPAE